MFFIQDVEIPENYSEHGVEKGAKILDYNIDDFDVLKIFKATKQMNLEDSITWLRKHENEFNPDTVIIDTDCGDSLFQYRERHPRVFVSMRYLNRVQHLNTLLNRANEELADGGYLWCHCRTSALKKKIILRKYPPIINWIIYLLHYFWHRVIPKISRFTRKIYFAVTKGQSRTYSRVELLGRLCRAGFEIIDEEFRFGEFFVIARKVKDPIWDDKPAIAPIIKLNRIGKDRKIIGVYKFRTMYSYSEYLQPYIYKYNKLREGGKFADDYRINIWGKIFRSLWWDELPMFINVFRGEIKLVGVRPLSPQYFSLYTPEMQALHTKVKPGLLPPFYYDRHTPKTIEEVQASERRYIEAYLKHPFYTDCRYFFGIVVNIIKGKRSK